jgi:hypothetical protein
MRFRSAIIAAGMASATCTPVGGKQLVFDGSRPVEKAVHDLQKRFSMPVAYEDPRYSFVEDIEQDITSSRDLARYPSGLFPQVLIPRKHRLVVEDNPDSLKVLRSLLEAEARAGVVFELREMNGMFAVVPSRVRGPDGSFHAETPVLDAKISLPDGERSVMSALHEICAAVTSATGVPVRAGRVEAGKPLRVRRVRTSATDKPAREVLRSVLAGTVKNPYWILSYDVTKREYALDIMDLETYGGP